jgi:hypothetical protein
MEWQFLVGWSLGILNFVTTIFLYYKQKPKKQEHNYSQHVYENKYFNTVNMKDYNKNNKNSK